MKINFQKSLKQIRYRNSISDPICYNKAIESEENKKTKSKNNLTQKGIITMKKQFFMIDFANKTISGSKNAFRKANDTSSREYAELSEKMARHPDFDIKEKVESQKSKDAREKKETYPGLNRDMIKDCVSILSNEDLTLEYKATSKMKDNKFTDIKKWFIQYLKDNNINYKDLKTKVELVRLEKVKETIREEEAQVKNASNSNSDNSSNITKLENNTKEAANQ